jgi:hypothetical protein
MFEKYQNRFQSCEPFFVSCFRPFSFLSRTFKNDRLKSENGSRIGRDFPSNFQARPPDIPCSFLTKLGI